MTKSIGTSETAFRLSWIIADDFSLRLCTSWSKFRLPEHSKGDLAFADGVARGDRCTAVRVTRIMLTCIERRLVGLRRAAHPRQRLGLRSACVGHVEMRPVQHGLHHHALGHHHRHIRAACLRDIDALLPPVPPPIGLPPDCRAIAAALYRGRALHLGQQTMRQLAAADVNLHVLCVSVLHELDFNGSVRGSRGALSGVAASVDGGAVRLYMPRAVTSIWFDIERQRHRLPSLNRNACAFF